MAAGKNEVGFGQSKANIILTVSKLCTCPNLRMFNCETASILRGFPIKCCEGGQYIQKPCGSRRKTVSQWEWLGVEQFSNPMMQ